MVATNAKPSTSRIVPWLFLALLATAHAANAWQNYINNGVGEFGNWGVFYGTAAMPNGDVVATGALYDTTDNAPPSDRDWLIARFDGVTGAVVWYVTISGGSGPGMGVNDQGFRIAVDGNGDVFTSGTILKPDNSGDSAGIVKLDGVTGDILWQALVPCGRVVGGFAVDANNDLVVGNCQVNGSDTNLRIFKLNGTTHTIIWDYVEPSSAPYTINTGVKLDGAGDVLASKVIQDDSGNRSWGAVKLSGFTGSPIWTQNVIKGPGVVGPDPDTQHGCSGSCVISGWPGPGDGPLTNPFGIMLDDAGDLLISGTSWSGIPCSTNPVQPTLPCQLCGNCRDRYYDFTIAKIANGDGSVVWRKVFDDENYGGLDFYGSADNVTADGSGTVFAAGVVWPQNQFVAALNGADGSTLWVNRDFSHGGCGGRCSVTDITRLANGHIAASYSAFNVGDYEGGFATAFAPADGSELWQATRPSSGFNPVAWSLSALPDGGLAVGMQGGGHAGVVKLNENDGTYSHCGDGVIDSGELCDDGNTASFDCCSPSCIWNAANLQPCGLRPDGSARGVCDGRGHCLYCGNGVVEPGEECDDGNNVDGDCCSSTCHVEANGSSCDDHNPQTTNDHCSGGYCVACGDGRVVYPDETCDDGNTLDGDCCSSSCQLELGTPCDDHLACSTASQCDNSGNCRPVAGNCCGDGVVQPTLGEQCDDGNASDDDCCLSNCQLAGDGASCTSVYHPACNPTSQCAGTACVAGPSTCDCCTPHAGPGCNDLSCQHCVLELDSSCVSAEWYPRCADWAINACAYYCSCSHTCGNGVVEPGEECDDGNTVSGDCCSSTCTREAGCQSAVCGNHIIEPGETCDDGNTVSGDCCSSTCQREPGCCGNGVLNSGEQCDDGNNVAGDCCSPTCFREPGCAVCGDGFVEAGEECDDGNRVSGDCCSANCQIAEDCAPHFKCYKASTTKHTTAPPAVQVTLEDQLGPDTLVASKPNLLCNPVDVNGVVGTAGDSLHLEWYKTKDITRTPFSISSEIHLRTEFGDVHVTKVVKPIALGMPTATNGVTTDLSADRLRCYKVKGYGDLPLGVTLHDGFETNEPGNNDMSVGEPVVYCNPAQETFASVRNPQRHLICYRITWAGKLTKFVPQSVTTENDLGNGSLTAKKRSMLCMGALVVP